MEEEIKRVVKLLKNEFLILWIVPVIIVVLGETEVLPVGTLADTPKCIYYLNTLSILISVISVPLALKLFSLVLVKKIDQLTLPIALKRYRLWSSVRLYLLLGGSFCNLLIYYMTFSTTGVLCAAIGLVASFFCLPGEKRLREELHIIKE